MKVIMYTEIRRSYQSTICDKTGKTTDHIIGVFVRGATGRVCCVLEFDYDSSPELHDKLNTLEEIEVWAESEPGGYLDY
jgi:hypothetical protein